MLATTGCSARPRREVARPWTPVPQSRISRAPLAVVTSTHEVLPPKWTVPGPGVAIEPLVPQKRTLMASRGRRASGARLALRIDRHGPARRVRHLHAMLLPMEVVRHVPVGGCLARHARAALHVLGRAVAGGDMVATDIRADGSAGDRAAGRGDVLAASAPDLMAENAADDGADKGARDVGLARRGRGGQLLTLHPAALFRGAHHGTSRSHIRFEHALLVAAAVVIGSDRCGGIALILDVLLLGHHAHGRDAVVEAHRLQGTVLAGPKDDAAPTEARVLAGFPALAGGDHQRGGAVVEADSLEVADFLARGEVLAAEALMLVEDDGRGGLGAERDAGQGHCAFQDLVHGDSSGCTDAARAADGPLCPFPADASVRLRTQ